MAHSAKEVLKFLHSDNTYVPFTVVNLTFIPNLLFYFL